MIARGLFSQGAGSPLYFNLLIDTFDSEIFSHEAILQLVKALEEATVAPTGVHIWVQNTFPQAAKEIPHIATLSWSEASASACGK